MPDMFKDVKTFHRFFGHPVGTKPQLLPDERMEFRMDRMHEELEEIRDACEIKEDFTVTREQKIVDIADGLADLIYYALGTAVEMGLPFDKIWDAVQKANMAKKAKESHEPVCEILAGNRCSCGAVLYDRIGKTMKPMGWVGPEKEIAGILGGQ